MAQLQIDCAWIQVVHQFTKTRKNLQGHLKCPSLKCLLLRLKSCPQSVKVVVEDKSEATDDGSDVRLIVEEVNNSTDRKGSDTTEPKRLPTSISEVKSSIEAYGVF
eukprot:GHVT01023464.1.p2 GENE.GHVT01023464.1~~GHVT01023464.1.p2  ORF type:complete len:106 (+),score=4.54 GHVT01023464.1:573-890(+)